MQVPVEMTFSTFASTPRSFHCGQSDNFDDAASPHLPFQRWYLPQTGHLPNSSCFFLILSFFDRPFGVVLKVRVLAAGLDGGVDDFAALGFVDFDQPGLPVRLDGL